jgi:hypothetical protein
MLLVRSVATKLGLGQFTNLSGVLPMNLAAFQLKIPFHQLRNKKAII